MFNTAKDFKDYIKKTLKSKGACSAPSQAGIWQIYNSKKFHPIGSTYYPNGDGFPLEGDGKVTWKYNHTMDSNNNHKFCAFYLGYEDKILNKSPVLFLHFEYDTNNIYNIGVELMKVDASSIFILEAPNSIITNHIFTIF